MNRIGKPQVALLATILILLVVAASVGQRLVIRSHSSLSCLVEDSRTGGGSGIRDWAVRMGYSTVPLRSPIWEIGNELAPSGNCLITAGNDSWHPADARLAEEHWAAISSWICAGNALIVITSMPTLLPEQIKDHFTSKPAESESNDKVQPSFDSKRRLISMKSIEHEAVPTQWGGEMSVNVDGPRLRDAPREQQLAGRLNASVLTGKNLDRGKIYLLLDDEAWANGGFDRADNAATLARILKQNLGTNGVLAFDEYRHGYGRVESFTTLFLSLPAAKDFSLMALIWCLFWLWSSTRRLSPPEEYHDPERRSVMEYIQSVASMNQRARAAPLTVKAVSQRVRYLAQKRGIIDQALNTMLDRADEQVVSAQRPAMPKKEIELVSELIQMRRKLYGTRRNP